jgi:hypothetical protein
LIAAATSEGVLATLAARINAAAPATCGEAIEVPLIVLSAVLLVYQAEVIDEPGANKSRQLPKFEYVARASTLVVAPTVIALGSRAGDERQASALLLPAATTTVTPLRTRLATAVSTLFEAHHLRTCLLLQVETPVRQSSQFQQ